MKRSTVIAGLLLGLLLAWPPAEAGWNGCKEGFCSPPVAAGGGCSQATAFLARNGNAHPTETTNLICGMVTDGDWASMDAVYILATDTQAHALLNAVSTSFTATAQNNGANPTFTANTGFSTTTGGSKFGYLDTGFAPNAGGTNYVLNSASIGFCNLLNSTAGNSSTPMGINNSLWVIQNQGGSDFFDVNDANFPAVASTNHQGFWVVTRTAASGAGAVSLYHAGSSTPVATDTGSSASLSASNVFILGSNNGGSVVRAVDVNENIAFAFIGGGLTGAAYARIAARVSTYLTALGLSGC